jgi:hypothetical protein
MNLLYLTFGNNISNHIQAHFSIWTFLTQRNRINTINVITEYPAFYNSLKDFINIIPIDKDTLKQWKGKYDFFWRIKIKAIEMLCNQYNNEPVVYLDSDTFLYHNIKSFKEDLSQGTAFMYENEGPLSNAKSKTEKKMWYQIQNKVFGSTPILSSHSMWNAGIVATPNSRNNEECLLALEICDEMCEQGVTRRLIEQFALSLSLHKLYGLHTASNTIAHYWSNKGEWNETIEQFFISSYFKTKPPDQIIEEILKFDFNKLPIKKKLKNTNIRLQNFIQKIFPPENLSFVNNNLE